MRRVLRWVAGFLIVILLLAVGLFAVSRLRGPTAEQREAMELLKDDTRPQGRNAFSAIWLLAYDVPEDQQASITAEDVSRLARRPYLQPGGESGEAFETSAAARFPRLAARERDDRNCSLREAGCLAKVRGARESYVQWRASNERLIQRALDVSEYDYFRNDLPPRTDMPFPELQHFSMLPTLRALDFVEGRVDASIAGVCTDIGMWRKLSHESDMLLFNMLAVAAMEGSFHLLSDMLVELPATYTLPAACASVREAPRVGEFNVCAAMRGEARMGRNLSVHLKSSDGPAGNPLANLLFPVFYDAEGMYAMMATTYAWPCSQAAASAMAQDRMLRTPLPEQSLLRLECVANAVGCILSEIASPAFETYPRRSQDAGARLKLMGTVLWLYEHPEGSRTLAERLASRPEELKSPTRDIEIVDDGKALAIRLFDTDDGATWQLPLPVHVRAGEKAN